MIGGDPTGKGKGGQSVYGDFFNDEFSDSLKHSERGIGMSTCINWVFYLINSVTCTNKIR